MGGRGGVRAAALAQRTLRRAARGAARRTTAGGSYAGVSTGAVVLRANASDAASALFAALRPTAAGFALGPVDAVERSAVCRCGGGAGLRLLTDAERLAGLQKHQDCREEAHLLGRLAKLEARRFPWRHRARSSPSSAAGLAKSIHHARVLIRQRHIRVGKQIVNIPSFMVRTESQKHIDFAITSPYGGGRPGRKKRKSIAAKGGGGDADEDED